MFTKRLYDENSYIREFDARVLSCEEGKNGYEVVLDETAFFPEGGGQPADQGFLNDVRVTDVRDKKDYVLHICSQSLKPGSLVHGRIDWERRFLHMQQHSGEHIFSGIVHRLHGYDNIGFHMGKDFVTVDFSGLLTEEEIAEAEKQANTVVLTNERILAEYPCARELETLEYRSKKEIDGAVRIVTVPGADVCACCGTHVKRTGEIGPIKVTSSEHYKTGIRLTLEIGWRALEDYEEKHRNVKAISALLSVKPEETAAAVQKQQELMQELRLQNNGLKQRLFEMMVKEIPEGQEKTVIFEDGLNAVEIRKLADMLSERTGLAAVFSGSDGEGYKYVVCSRQKDAAALGKDLNRELNGRGGGKNPMIQGSVQAEKAEIREFFEKVY
ncbi:MULTISPECIES: alanyl-tRNA editing protein [Eisenbergiella]|uniref:Alanyl-tRNA editing protein n=1 Tax=Eisenbergiella porci TaxID=2652274 RepID=A0A6N7W2D2_9FIRM|nr:MULTISPECIES: alanine--tRNA ligase-related protein [Eisenbergiella]MDY2653744.1 alanine--tRNA ligase-related protein [Eisenbergiella porci]MSS89401.1 alanyl-tRNA editing protein [Eisenbergiella porci]